MLSEDAEGAIVRFGDVIDVQFRKVMQIVGCTSKTLQQVDDQKQPRGKKSEENKRTVRCTDITAV